jgi:hypothetical protein
VYDSVAESADDVPGDTVIQGTSAEAVHEQLPPDVFVIVKFAVVPPAGAAADSDDSAKLQLG